MSEESRVAFVTTRWDMVLAAGDSTDADSREELARSYWFPLYAFARARGVPPAEASDAVQTFLGRLFDRKALAELTVEGGRFRDFLRAGLVNQLISQHRAEHSARRRPENGFVFPDGLDPEVRLAQEPVDHRTPEQIYDRLWARNLLDSARKRLRTEYEACGREALFAHLAAHLDEETDAVSHATAAETLKLAAGTVRNEAVRFRCRFAAILRELVSTTLSRPERCEEELHHLIAALNS